MHDISKMRRLVEQNRWHRLKLKADITFVDLENIYFNAVFYKIFSFSTKYANQRN